MSDPVSRRDFVSKTAAGMGAASILAPAFVRAAASSSPNDTIRMGLIGCGGMGQGNMHSFMGKDKVEIVAVCDVDAQHMAAAARAVEQKYQRKPAQQKDYRRLLENKNIDAVIVATPDHWHALPTIEACLAGKDVYCEKPISHNILEGRMMVNAAQRTKRVVQIGTWQRSTRQFVEAIDFVRSGKLGKVSVCRAWLVQQRGTIGHTQASAPPPELDFDFWLGPAPKVPYHSNRVHYNFRWFFDYAGGMTGDWGVHMIDIALLGMDRWHPLEVNCMGGKIVLDDDRDTPDTLVATFRFADPRAKEKDFLLTWEVRWNNARPLDGGTQGNGTEFIGDRGSLVVDRGRWQYFPEDKKNKEEPGKHEVSDHWTNFLDCMRSRAKPRSDIESMHYTTTCCHLANISYRMRRRIFWDPRTETIVDDSEAMRCPQYARAYRSPWVLPRIEA